MEWQKSNFKEILQHLRLCNKGGFEVQFLCDMGTYKFSLSSCYHKIVFR